ncbi:bifunctional phosphoribosylaminoimidazolecarboxamide formyltransferase/IMP cyclohydrolase [Candidatus Fermentibacteria bacterium]|nr:bifunctional phosphoribosylaminoimidazolecarboxamide formyltransferase/IMP cyclohydrolase [Candidatus Fermentibacteria bacterium]
MTQTDHRDAQLIPIRRALLSVADKRGIEDLARCLASFGCELIASGGTRDHLASAGIHSTDVSELTGNPSAFEGRMKTISFSLASALLFDRDRHGDEAERLGIVPVDMVVCSFYPFAEARARGLPLEELVEFIDIGGPTMVRAAAKNARYVAVVTDCADYPRLQAELTQHEGALSLETRRGLMREAFALTADYDAAISTALDENAGASSLRIAMERGRPVRYGENPHQRATIYRIRGATHALHDCPLLHGKELSYNNMVDLQRALEAVRDLPRHGVAIIKHTNPCGLADAEDQHRAFELAWEGDPISAFGSVVAFSTPLSLETAQFLELGHPDKARRKFIEVIAAPRFQDEALVYLRQHRNLRVVVADAKRLDSPTEIRVAMNTALLQATDRRLLEELTPVGECNRDLDRPLIEFGLTAVRQLASNAIAVVHRVPDGACQLLGMGCGQPNRVGAIALALTACMATLARRHPEPAGFDAFVSETLACAVLTSDAFFPFPDNVDACARGGIPVVVQPGGSIRDPEVIQRAHECGITMVFSGLRHFRH